MGLDQALPEAPEKLTSHDGQETRSVFVQARHRPLQQLRSVRRVGIGEQQKIAVRNLGSLSARPRLSQPPLREFITVQDYETLGPALLDGSSQCAGLIIAPVIDNDHFEVGIVRGHERVQACHNVDRLIPSGHHNGNRGGSRGPPRRELAREPHDEQNKDRQSDPGKRQKQRGHMR